MRVLTVALVLALAGAIFGVSARTARGDEGRTPDDLAQLVANESDRVTDLQEQSDALQAEIDALSVENETPVEGSPGEAEITANRIAAGTTALTGPGLRVALDDAPPGNYPEQFRPDDLVVHQQDLQAVVNGLWAGGAEAMTLQSQRVDPTTAFRCVGNVLVLKGRVYSPPFVVEAIGDQDAMRSALDRAPDVQAYMSYVDAVSLGWRLDEVAKIEVPRSDQVTLTYAQVQG
ncbi:membrane protein [Sediminihabitans luteus]|nr:membrane protein [Sediminihabitans luteus]